MNIRQIAKLAGVSHSTVSRVLAGKGSNIPISARTREKILKVCEENNYTPSIHASRFFSKRAKTVGVFSPESHGLEDENFAKFMSAVYFGLSEIDYRILPGVMDKDFFRREEYLKCFNRQEVDLLIIWGVRPGGAWLEELRRKRFPFILASNSEGDNPSITCDNKAGTAAMTRFCIEKGAKRLVFAAGPPVDICLRRQEGFMETASGREVKIIDTGFCIQDGINIAEEILAWNPDAVVCSNDEVAIGVLEGFKAKGVKVPERMLLTGADNIRMSEFCSVPLTTFDQMAYECGRKCVESVKDFLLKKKPMQSVVIPPEVMRRRTA